MEEVGKGGYFADVKSFERNFSHDTEILDTDSSSCCSVLVTRMFFFFSISVINVIGLISELVLLVIARAAGQKIAERVRIDEV